jgi:hypothetical protein
MTESFRYKPYLIFFDISKCAKPSVVFSGCPTQQVCVEKCPTEYYYPYDNLLTEAGNKKTKKYMLPFCSSQVWTP